MTLLLQAMFFLRKEIYMSKSSFLWKMFEREICLQRELREDQIEVLHLIREVAFSDEDFFLPDVPFKV